MAAAARAGAGHRAPLDRRPRAGGADPLAGAALVERFLEESGTGSAVLVAPGGSRGEPVAPATPLEVHGEQPSHAGWPVGVLTRRLGPPPAAT